jgi:hypothetical protein
MRISAFDQLDGRLDCYVRSRSEQKVNMLGHENKRMQLITAVPAISIKSFQEKSNVRFHDEEPAALPG